MSPHPGYTNILIKSWANIPGGRNGLCCAKNNESIPETGTWSHPVHSKTRWLQLQNPLSPAKCGKVELFSGLLCCPCFSRAGAIPRDWPQHPWEAQPSWRHQGSWQVQVPAPVLQINEETSVCSCWVGKGFLLHCCHHERSFAFPGIDPGPKDFTMQGRHHLLVLPQKVLCLSFICPEESSAWLLSKIWAALHFPFPFFFFFSPRRKF